MISLVNHLVHLLELTMLLVLGCPMVLVLPKEKELFWVVVAEPNGLKRLEAGCCGWPNKLPVVVPNAPVPVMQTVNTYIQDTHTHTQTEKKSKTILKVQPLTSAKWGLVLAEVEASVWSWWAKESSASTGSSCGCRSKETPCARCHGIGRTLPSSLIILKPQFLRWRKESYRYFIMVPNPQNSRQQACYTFDCCRQFL